MTNSARNGYLDGSGDLNLTALNQGGAWTSARIQITTPNAGAPARGRNDRTAGMAGTAGHDRRGERGRGMEWQAWPPSPDGTWLPGGALHGLDMTTGTVFIILLVRLTRNR